MRRPPRDPRERLFGRQTLVLEPLAGPWRADRRWLAFYAAALLLGYGDDEARALSFSTLIVANLGLIFVEPVVDRDGRRRGSGRRTRRCGG